MSLIPDYIRAQWQVRTRTANKAVLDNLIEFKEFYDEYKHNGMLIQAYREGAEDNGMSVKHFQERVLLVIRFPDDKLYYWFRHGISFNHLEKAVSLDPDNPAGWIDKCVNEYGRPETVDSMIATVLAERPDAERQAQINNLVSLVCRKFRHWLGADVPAAFESELKTLINKYLDRF